MAKKRKRERDERDGSFDFGPEGDAWDPAVGMAATSGGGKGMIGRSGTLRGHEMSGPALGMGAGAMAYGASQKRNGGGAGKEQFDYYSNLPPPPRQDTSTPMTVSSAGIGGGATMAGVGAAAARRSQSQSHLPPSPPPAQRRSSPRNDDPYGGLADEYSGANEGGWGVARGLSNVPYNGGPEQT